MRGEDAAQFTRRNSLLTCVSFFLACLVPLTLRFFFFLPHFFSFFFPRTVLKIDEISAHPTTATCLRGWMSDDHDKQMPAIGSTYGCFLGFTGVAR